MGPATDDGPRRQKPCVSTIHSGGCQTPGRRDGRRFGSLVSGVAGAGQSGVGRTTPEVPMSARLPLALVALLSLAALAGCSKKKTTTPPNAGITGTVRHLDGSAYSSAYVDAESLVPVGGSVDIATALSDGTGAFAFG